MTAQELLRLLERNSVGIAVDGDKLKLRAPKGFVTEEIAEALKARKQDIIALLRARDAEQGEATRGEARPGDTGAPAHEGEIPRRAAGMADCPLSYAQQQLWLMDQLSPGNPFYNNPVALWLHGPLDPAALHRSLDRVIERHASLRTVFLARDGEPVQQVRPPESLAFPCFDFTDLPEAAREAAAHDLAERHALDPFDLEQGPPIRACLARLADQRHLWLLNVHHIAADGWSIGILLRELAAHYAHFVGVGEAEPPPEPGLQYPDYACWQRAALTEAALSEQLDYWKSALDGAPTVHALPTDRPRPLVQRFRGDGFTLHAPPALDAAVDALARRAGCTAFAVYAAAFSAFLWRYSGQRDLCIGTPFANRNHAEVEPLIGHFINTVVLRAAVDPAADFERHLRAVRERVFEAYAHQDVPFERVVEAVNPVRHAGHAPLFQVMLAVQNMPGTGMGLPGLEVVPMPTSTHAAKFDLSVEITRTDDGSGFGFEFDTDLFERETVERMARHYLALLEDAVRDPAKPLSALRMLDADEVERQLRDWNATVHVADPTRGEVDDVVAAFEQHARARPQATAVRGGGADDEAAEDALSYAELNARADAVAAALIRRGAGAGRIVGVRMARSPATAVALLGILKAGAAYLPLDPAYPQERIDLLVEDAAPALVVVEDDVDDGVRVGLRRLESEAVTAPSVSSRIPDPDEVAYVIYTSGSTGRPKGVAITRRGIANIVGGWIRRVGVTAGDRCAQWCSLGFDVSMHELLMPLSGGGELRFVPEEIRNDPEACLDWMRRARIAQAYLPPAFVRWIGESPRERLRDLPLRALLVGVEPLQEASLHAMTEALPGLRIVNGYGPTETCVYSTAYAGIEAIERQCPIGRPVDNTRVYLLDESLRPVPIGVVGDLYIAGDGLARGYLSAPALTAERFLPDPYAPHPGQRMYRSGDRARFLAGGDIEYVGRADDQIKVRGFRVEIGEIETVLREDPEVRDAAVVAERQADGEYRLIAAVVAADAEASKAGAEWKTRLGLRLPRHMVPSIVFEIDTLPQTRNGKVDREAIVALAMSAGSLLQVNQANPRDRIELRLYELWRAILLHPAIGIRDSFYEIGGTSISAIKLAHEIRREFSLPVSIRDIILHPTIEMQGGLLRRGGSAGQDGNLIEFRAGEGRARVVCIHPAGGTAFCYLSVARILPDAVGVYGIQSHGVNIGERFLPDVESMADSYLETIGHLLDGDVILAGLSYGGSIAYEMGARLHRAGHRRVSVVLLDTQGIDAAEDRALVSPVPMDEFKRKLVKFNGMYPGIDDRQIRQYYEIYNHNRTTMQFYVPEASQARLVLIQACGGRDKAFLREARHYWKRRALGDFRFALVRGDHWEMLETEEIKRVGKALRRELDFWAVADPEPDVAAGHAGAAPAMRAQEA